MSSFVGSSLQKTVLALLSAVLFVCFFELNGWLFHDFEHKQGINWLFLPAGFRVILVLVLGLPGALGLMLGSWYIDAGLIDGPNILLAFLNGVAGGLTPWLVMKYLQKQQWLSDQLQKLNPLQLLNLTLSTSAASAAAHQMVWLWLERPQTNFWVDVWPMFIGNVTGALVMLYGFKFVLDRMRLVHPNR
ncbi:hypothetical protein [Limnohabitans sp. G3-2]|uniref:hypothetical protein n=1 Tax=Limnohabitans sp. G3-2 TaxID=1100711 RepID=UPI001E481D8E|nr:hypothetical protein [Limnohabitans sp. G3-2]